ncbi:MAG: prolyl oligopeptidase family serine peptidase [Deltaproteobacteria bacterium]|nr:prolyl oligopeptidase family serine peptidase [Deltaproteobacteria bacterium]
MAASNWQQIESDNSAMRMHVSLPEGSGPFPGLVVIQHQGGVDPFVQSMTARLAQAGYGAAAPDLYHRDGLDCTDDIITRRSRLSDRKVINDVNSTVSFLQSQSAVDGNRLGIIGFCMGGRVVYLMATANPRFKAAVAYYAGNTFRAWGRDIPSPFERTPEIHCPLQGHFGAEDKNPSPEDMQKLDAELTKFNKTHEFYSYPNAGHAFMDSTSESYRRHADEASWPRTLEFLNRHLSQ